MFDTYELRFLEGGSPRSSQAHQLVAMHSIYGTVCLRILEKWFSLPGGESEAWGLVWVRTWNRRIAALPPSRKRPVIAEPC